MDNRRQIYPATLLTDLSMFFRENFTQEKVSSNNVSVHDFAVTSFKFPLITSLGN